MNNQNSFKRTIAVSVMIIFIAAGCATQSQTFTSELTMGNALNAPKFDFFIVNYPAANPDSSAGDLYARLRYDDLIFVKTDSGFMVHYQLSLNLYKDRSRTESRYSHMFDRRIMAAKYSQTVSTMMYDTLTDKMVMEPGKYFAVLRFTDLNTNVTSSKEFEYTFKDFFSDPIDISDVLLYDNSDTTGVPIGMFNNNSENLFAVFYVTSQIVPANIYLHLVAKSTEAPTAIDTIYAIDQTSQVQRYRLPVNVGGLAPADYDLRISVKGGGKENFAETAFKLTGNLAAMTGLDHEIGPLGYIMTKFEFDSLKSETVEQREEMLDDFWLARSHRDTVVADAMRKEFYRRVDAADGQFGTAMVQGWQTDRGRIYILYGKPDRIENHAGNFARGPMVNSPPYQIWYYDSLKLRFVFVDELRNGNYRLAKMDGT